MSSQLRNTARQIAAMGRAQQSKLSRNVAKQATIVRRLLNKQCMAAHPGLLDIRHVQQSQNAIRRVTGPQENVQESVSTWSPAEHAVLAQWWKV